MAAAALGVAEGQEKQPGATPPLQPGTPPAREESPTVVVTAPSRDSAEEIRRLARSITPQVRRDTPIPRFSDPVCFGIAGVGAPLATAIVARANENAAQAGISVVAPPCRPNVLISFVRDGRQELERLDRTDSKLILSMAVPQRRALMREAGPVWTWNAVNQRGWGGELLDYGQFSRGVPTVQTTVMSRLAPPIRNDTLVSVILVELPAIVGKTVTQVADYLTMRGLGGARPPRSDGGDTILRLFEPGSTAKAAEMTSFDRGYLRTLYRLSPYDFARRTIARMSRDMADGRGSAAPPVGD